MIAHTITLIRDGVGYIREHPQLLLTLLLIAVIPCAFLITAEQFLRAAQENQERAQKDRIGLMHDVFASLVTAADVDREIIAEEIRTIAAVNPDIRKFRIARDDGAQIVPIAALDEDHVGEPEDAVSAYRLADVTAPESVINEYYTSGERRWQAFRLIRGPNEEKLYIFTETSLAGTDAVVAARVREAYYWLFGLLAVVMLLTLRHVRLIDYGHLYRRAREANEMKDLFTNMIAHELRAPLTAMRGYASMIAENSEAPRDVREQGERIQTSAERLVLIINDLLDVARIQSGKLSVTKKQVDVAAVVSAVAEELKSTAMDKGVTLTTTGIGSSQMVVGDEKRLHQALTNVVSNAIKYTDEGSIEIALTAKRDRVELRVKDTGMGISADDQEKLFAPFFRASGADVSKITGTGLGMWITKQLIELMGASIGVESIKGVGTHVVITLPKNST